MMTTRDYKSDYKMTTKTIDVSRVLCRSQVAKAHCLLSPSVVTTAEPLREIWVEKEKDHLVMNNTEVWGSDSRKSTCGAAANEAASSRVAVVCTTALLNTFE